MDYIYGRIAIDVTGDADTYEPAAVDLIDNLIPRTRQRVGTVDITRATFAPYESGTGTQSLFLISVCRLVNVADTDQQVNIDVTVRIDGAVGNTRPRIVTLEGFDSESPQTSLKLGAKEERTLAIAVSLARRTTSPGEEEIIRAMPAESQLEQTLTNLRSRYGRLTIEDDPYYGEFFDRQAELARQVALIDGEGLHAGSFWGSDANDRPDVWMLDLYYSMLPMAQLDPTLCRSTIDFFVRYGLPPAAWGNFAANDEGHPLEGVAAVSHSIGNVTAAIALAGAYISATGDTASLLEDQVFIDYGINVIELLLSSREAGDVLFPSVFISDGPSRGDFHTGSNIKAWYALKTMSRLLALSDETADQAARWNDEADRVRAAIFELCAGNTRFGPQFYEGAWRDGTHVAGHDGEESDLTLASFYGFADVDEPNVINHALAAFTTDNPYFVPSTRGISWWDFQWHGPTFPGFIHALSASSIDREALAALEAIRARTDLDGSVWWWPHFHDEIDYANVLRGPGKCGWAAGTYISKFIHDILGLKLDASAERLIFAPFAPWSSFAWSSAVLGKFQFDAEYKTTVGSVEATIVNRSPHATRVTIELPIPEGASPKSVLVNGVESRETSRTGTRFARETIVVEDVVAAGNALELVLQVSPHSTGSPTSR